MSMMLKQRKEAIKEIIEADTDDMKEVLCSGQHLLPLNNLCCQIWSRRETMKKIIEADNDPMKEVLRPCYALGQHLLPHKNMLSNLCQGGRP